MTSKLILSACAVAIIASAGTGCSAFRYGVKEEDPEKVKPLRGKYDHHDLRSMPEEITSRILAHPFPPAKGEKPLIVAMGIENRTRTHLDMKALSDTITVKLLDSKKVRFVNAGARDKLLREQGYQLKNCPRDKRVKIGKQLGAKYMMTGALVQLGDRSGREVRVSKKEDVYYQLTLEMTDLETSEILVRKQVDRLRRTSEPIIGW